MSKQQGVSRHAWTGQELDQGFCVSSSPTKKEKAEAEFC